MEHGLTTTPSPSGFDTIVPKTLATRPVDRLPHHAHLNLAKGNSLPPQQAFGRGRPPSDGMAAGHRQRLMRKSTTYDQLTRIEGP